LIKEESKYYQKSNFFSFFYKNFFQKKLDALRLLFKKSTKGEFYGNFFHLKKMQEALPLIENIIIDRFINLI
jgi:hypothetical protein